MDQTPKKRALAERAPKLASIPALDFELRRRHVAELLKWRGVADADALARTWVLAFGDELDPTFSVIEWFDAGWRDPALVASAVDICQTQDNAEAYVAEVQGKVSGDPLNDDFQGGHFVPPDFSGDPSKL